jgi:hypothetical protein
MPTNSAATSGWSIRYSPDMPPSMSQNADGTYYVDLPYQEGLHIANKSVREILGTISGPMRCSCLDDRYRLCLVVNCVAARCLTSSARPHRRAMLLLPRWPDGYDCNRTVRARLALPRRRREMISRSP